MKKSSFALIALWSLSIIIIAWLLPIMARQSSTLDSFLSYCISFIK